MAAKNEYIYGFDDGGSLNKLEKKLQKFAAYMAKVQKDSGSPEVAAFVERFDAALRSSVQRLRELKTNLAAVNALIGKTGGQRFPAGSELEGKNVGGKFATQEQLKQVAKKATIELTREEARLDKEVERGKVSLEKLVVSSEAKKAAAAKQASEVAQKAAEKESAARQKAAQQAEQQAAQAAQAAADKRRAVSGETAQKEITDLELVRAKAQEFRKELDALTAGGAAPNLKALKDGYTQFADEATARIEKLRATLEALQALPTEGTQRLPAGSTVDGEQRGGKFADQEQISKASDEASVAIAREKLELANATAAAVAKVSEAQIKDNGLSELAANAEARRLDILRQIAALLPGGQGRRELVEERRNNLLQARKELHEQLLQQNQRFANEPGLATVANKAIENQTKLLDQLRDKQQALIQQTLRLKAAREAQRDAGVESAGARRGGASKDELTAFDQQDKALAAAYNDELNRQTLLIEQVGHLADRAAVSLEKLRNAEAAGEQGKGVAEIFERIQGINEQLSTINGGGQGAILDDLVGTDLNGELGKIYASAKRLAGTDFVDPEEAVKIEQLSRQLEDLKGKLGNVRTGGIPVRLNDNELSRDKTLLERTVVGAFDGIGRRFQASLQFAISGAILYGSQRLVREFYNAAVEVERTFADIGTSLEFDIAAPRGSHEFEQALEGVRHQVLQIADDFNVLPSAVNGVAFQMVSRFSDIDAAMTATRAQMLATRISTINQAEALQSLTAIAQSYGVEFANVADSTQRQRLQADLYMKTLNIATLIQQKYGIALEDTVEGAGSLTENFRQLGFTLEETLSIVAAASDKTDATGATIADRLARSLGQLETGEIRDKLLDLARASDDFQLSQSDFGSGAQAFRAIVDQIDRINPATLSSIAEAFGRRESPFVRSVLGDPKLLERILGDANTVGADGTQAIDRLNVLLDTTQGVTEGLAAQFEALGLAVQKLGILTPIKVFLQALTLALKLATDIVETVNTMFDALNKIRFGNTGLGDWLKLTLSMLGALTAVKSIIGAIGIALSTNSVLKLFANFLTGGKGGVVAKVVGGLAVGGLGGGLFSGAITGIKSLITAGKAMQTSLLTIRVAMAAMAVQAGISAAASVVSAAASSAAAAAEGVLSAARLRTAGASVVAALRTATWASTLLAVKTALASAAAVTKNFFGVLGKFGQLGAAVAFVGVLVELILALPTVIGGVIGVGDEESAIPSTARTKRAKDLQIEAAAAGSPITAIEAYRQAVSDELAVAKDALENSNAAAEVIYGLFATFLPNPRRLKGSTENLKRNYIESARAELQFAQQEINNRIELMRQVLAEGGSGDPADIAKLQAVSDNITEVLAGSSFTDKDGHTNNDLSISIRDIEAAQGEVEELVLTYEEWAAAFANLFEAGSLSGIQREFDQMKTRVALGRLDPDGQREEIAGLLERARSGLADARALNPNGSPAILEWENLINNLELGDLESFRSRLQQSIDLNQLLDTPFGTEQVQAELAQYRAALEEVKADPNLGGASTEREFRLQIALLEKQEAKLIADDAAARLEFAASSAKTFDERLAALQALKAAIQFQIIVREGIIAFVTGTAKKTLEELEKLNSIETQQAQTLTEQGVLEAKNAILRGASSQDELAAIAANIAGLEAELKVLEQFNTEQAVLTAKEIELRNEKSRLKLAEADRRASFYKLTAGTGDEIKAAQAELRATQDRLATILADPINGAGTKDAYDAELAVLVARKALADAALKQADLIRRLNSDLTNPLEQALLDVVAAQQELLAATGSLEKLEAEKTLVEAEAKAQREFYSTQLSDLDFLYQTDQLSRSRYVSALRGLQSGIDRTTRQGEELWRQIELQIRGLTEQASDLAFNIPTSIKLPTLFEVRRALEADALGVNYLDNRQQNITVAVSNELDLRQVLQAIEDIYGGAVDVAAARQARGAAGITIGGFN